MEEQESQRGSEKAPAKSSSMLSRVTANPDRSVSIAALVAALGALGVAVSSCEATQRQADLAQQALDLQRKMILLADFGDGTSLQLRPADSDQILQQGAVHFPDLIAKESMPLRERGTVYGMATIKYALESLLEKEDLLQEGYVSVGDLNIPVCVYSSYTATGETFQGPALYNLIARFVADGDRRSVSASFIDFVFVRRLSIDSSATKSMLNDEFKLVLERMRARP